MRVFLIRHGSVDHEDPEKPLSERGIKQAEELAKELKKYNFKKVYSSDLLRAKQTCEYFTKDYIEDKRLREIPGTLIGKEREEGVTKEILDRAKRDIENVFQELIKNKEDICVFCHSNVIVYYLNKILKLNQNLWGSLIVKHCSISILEVDGRKLKIKAINIIDHLSNELIEKVVYKSDKE
jgi:broad specificity phosphatase PhoE